MIWWRQAALSRLAEEIFNYSATKCLRFDSASAQYVDLGNVLGRDRNEPWTISFWIKRMGGGCIFGKMGNATTWRGLRAFVLDTGYLHLHMISDSNTSNMIQVYSGSTLPSGVWSHVCLSYDGSSDAAGVTLCVNGSAWSVGIFANALTGSILDDSSMMFGAMQAGDHHLFTGYLDDIAMFNRVLSADEAIALCNNGAPCEPPNKAGLIGWWPAGDGDTYPTMLDRSGAGHHGNMVNMTAANIVTR